MENPAFEEPGIPAPWMVDEPDNGAADHVPEGTGALGSTPTASDPWSDTQTEAPGISQPATESAPDPWSNTVSGAPAFTEPATESAPNPWSDTVAEAPAFMPPDEGPTTPLGGATETPEPEVATSPVGGSSLPSLDELLKRLVDLDGSDLHLKVGSPPAYRIDGVLHLAELPSLTPADTADFAEQVMPEHVREIFAEQNDADFAYGRRALGRFRGSCYRQRGSVNVVLRAVTPVTKTFDELGLPPSVQKLAQSEWGLIIVNGRAGTGKSTTLGAMVDFINESRRANIITLEDPIEMLHADKMSIVSQREVGLDTPSYSEGMRRALRQDADVIFMGEMRDREAIEAAMQAAETGKLVLTSMLTADAAETINRIIEAFPPFQQRQARYTLGAVLRGVISHRLLPRADGRGRAPAVEILTNTERTYERIIDPELTAQLLDAIVDGSFYGMQSFDQALLKLVEKRVVTFEDAITHATDPTDFKLAAQALGLGG